MNNAPLRELILYATPTGDLAERCDRYFADAAALGVTTAQTYPPHCTLTGFFRRGQARVDTIAAEVADVIGDDGAVPEGEVEVVRFMATGEWIGLELTSPWLTDLTARFVEAHTVLPDEDELRPKDWLHLSLAYGVDDLLPYRELAEASGMQEPADGGWEVGLWERHLDRSWQRHTPITPG